MQKKTTDDDEYKAIHYVKGYMIDLRRSIGDYNSQTLSHKTRKKRNIIHKVFVLLVC